MENNTRFNSINSYLRKVFGRKTVKLSIDGGFTCPNRDGTLGTGGCAFCSPDGSGEMASDIDGQIELLSKKWPDAAYIGYFQSHTNTYEPVEDLRRKYYSVLQDPLHFRNSHRHKASTALVTRCWTFFQRLTKIILCGLNWVFRLQTPKL